MGNFFTSTQIYNNEKLGKDDFILNFCKKMEEEGYVPCDSDESEIAYILRFADNSNWVTITSEAYGQGNALSHKDTGRIAKMLGTTCVNTVVIDSDCAILELYDKNGKKADMFTIGRADDYFGDDIPQPTKKIWKSFLSKDSSWEQFTQICSSDEVFVEDSLSKLAPVIGMDAGNILFSVDDATEDEHTVFLNFKKDAVKKEKKLSLNAAFKQVFGEALEPLGFKLVKSKYPYYLRVVDEGIVQAVSFAKEKLLNIDSNRNEEEIAIYVGIDLLINPLINFDKDPTVIDNQKWMMSLSDLYGNFIANMDDFNEKHESYTFFYKKGNTEEMLDALKKNSQEFMPFVLEFFEKSKTLEDIYCLGEITSSIRHDVIILLGKTDELIEEYKVKLTKEIARLESVHVNKNPALLKIFKERTIKFTEEAMERATLLRKGTKEYNVFITTAEETKEHNLKTLKNLGVM